MPRFYVPTDLSVNSLITLPDPVFHHWVKVLRARPGEQAILFNGQGGEYTVTLHSIDKNQASVHINRFDAAQRVPGYQVILGQVMSKGDRMDYAVQKATELGVSAIQLLISERCEMRLKYDRNQKKIEHWQQVAIAACEQCGMNRIPPVLAPLPLEEWVSQPVATAVQKLVMAPGQPPVQWRPPLPSRIHLLIGPEGGLTEAELQLARTHGYMGWSLGERILRTETAPVVGLTALMVQYNATMG